MNSPPALALKVLHCPFCGDQPVVEPWIGRDARGSTVIYCKNAFCYVSPSVRGKTIHIALKYWNTRNGK